MSFNVYHCIIPKKQIKSRQLVRILTLNLVLMANQHKAFQHIQLSCCLAVI